ncbi:MAG: thioesterase family protein, partial [Actinobacteria bacterium]|nr:thioesterase family protein [Actinomycetota bacterium]
RRYRDAPRVVRAARSAVLAEVTVSADGRDCLHCRVWFVRMFDTSVQSTPLNPAGDPLAAPAGLAASFPYGDSLEWRFVRGRMDRSGPAAAWVRPCVPLLPGHDLSGLARAALIADSGNGISSVLDWSRWSFVNVDLDIHLARPVEGDWLLLDAVTQVGAHGSALARSTLSDLRGEVGAGLQTLVVTPASQPAAARLSG